MGALNDKAVVVTGSGRGIGEAIARLAAAEGAAVVVTDIDAAEADKVAKAINESGGKAVAHAADISDWKGASGLIECCMDSYGRIDGLVNNAGIFHLARVEEMTEADLRATLASNVLGTAFTARHAAPHMMKQKSGSIVNVTSGAHFGLLTMGAYGASKGAVASFTYTWAAELKDHNIRVNAMSPFASTRMSQSGVAYYKTRNVSQRVLPQPAANAPVVVYLLSDQASGVTGQIVRIEGKELSLVSHPAVALPVLVREAGWDVESVARAFRDELGKRQFPTGVAGLEARPAPIVKKSWD